ncbi:MAG TPA: hypothetical protein VKZ89_11145 [Thermobifida alba]|nr:hypothetical protein [Thermobifida alba]
MFRHSPSPLAAEQRSSPPYPLRPALVRHRVFGAGSPFNKANLPYLYDMAKFNKVTVRPDFDPDTARCNSHADMARGLVELLPPLEQVDAILVAYGIPEMAATAPAFVMNTLLPSATMAFTVSDQGIVAPHSALRLAGEFAKSSGFRRILLVVLEVATLPCDTEPPPETVPSRDSAVAVLLEEAEGGTGTAVRQRTGVNSRTLPEALRDELEVLLDGRDPAAVVCGATVAPESVPDRFPVRAAAREFPGTGTWAALGALERATREDDRPVVLVDYEPLLGYLCLARMERPVSSASAEVIP